MKKRTATMMLAISSVVLSMGCTPQAMDNNRTGTQSTQPLTDRPLHDAAVIPSVDSGKRFTTNQYGSNYSGMGSSTLSRIGSSGLYGGGISVKLESILADAGIIGMKVFVIDDTVILGDAGRGGANAAQYDELQSKVLSNTSGTSGTGRKHAEGMSGTLGTKGIPTSDRHQAKQAIERFTGGEVRILVVEHKDALRAIDRLRANMQKKGMPLDKVADDLKLLLKHAR